MHLEERSQSQPRTSGRAFAISSSSPARNYFESGEASRFCRFALIESSIYNGLRMRHLNRAHWNAEGVPRAHAWDVHSTPICWQATVHFGYKAPRVHPSESNSRCGRMEGWREAPADRRCLLMFHLPSFFFRSSSRTVPDLPPLSSAASAYSHKATTATTRRSPPAVSIHSGQDLCNLRLMNSVRIHLSVTGPQDWEV